MNLSPAVEPRSMLVREWPDRGWEAGHLLLAVCRTQNIDDIMITAPSKIVSRRMLLEHARAVGYWLLPYMSGHTNTKQAIFAIEESPTAAKYGEKLLNGLLIMTFSHDPANRRDNDVDRVDVSHAAIVAGKLSIMHYDDSTVDSVAEIFDRLAVERLITGALGPCNVRTGALKHTLCAGAAVGSSLAWFVRVRLYELVDPHASRESQEATAILLLTVTAQDAQNRRASQAAQRVIRGMPKNIIDRIDNLVRNVFGGTYENVGALGDSEDEDDEDADVDDKVVPRLTRRRRTGEPRQDERDLPTEQQSELSEAGSFSGIMTSGVFDVLSFMLANRNSQRDLNALRRASRAFSSTIRWQTAAEYRETYQRRMPLFVTMFGDDLPVWFDINTSAVPSARLFRSITALGTKARLAKLAESKKMVQGNTQEEREQERVDRAARLAKLQRIVDISATMLAAIGSRLREREISDTIASTENIMRVRLWQLWTSTLERIYRSSTLRHYFPAALSNSAARLTIVDGRQLSDQLRFASPERELDTLISRTVIPSEDDTTITTISDSLFYLVTYTEPLVDTNVRENTFSVTEVHVNNAVPNMPFIARRTLLPGRMIAFTHDEWRSRLHYNRTWLSRSTRRDGGSRDLVAGIEWQSVPRRTISDGTPDRILVDAPHVTIASSTDPQSKPETPTEFSQRIGRLDVAYDARTIPRVRTYAYARVGYTMASTVSGVVRRILLYGSILENAGVAVQFQNAYHSPMIHDEVTLMIEQGEIEESEYAAEFESILENAHEAAGNDVQYEVLFLAARDPVFGPRFVRELETRIRRRLIAPEINAEGEDAEDTVQLANNVLVHFAMRVAMLFMIFGADPVITVWRNTMPFVQEYANVPDAFETWLERSEQRIQQNVATILFPSHVRTPTEAREAASDLYAQVNSIGELVDSTGAGTLRDELAAIRESLDAYNYEELDEQFDDILDRLSPVTQAAPSYTSESEAHAPASMSFADDLLARSHQR